MSRFLSLLVIFTSLATTLGGFDFSCPDGEFECVSSQTCIPNKWKCDGDEDCSNGEDENDCGGPITCQSGYYKCNNSRCIASSWICDGHEDCPEKDDEAPFQKCTNSKSLNDSRTTCRPGSFQCKDGDCIRADFKCDHEQDCDDNSDEEGCPALVCNDNQFKCDHNRTCISENLKCNGQNDCTDASDEKDCQLSCADNKFQCKNGDCIAQAWRCDGDNDCDDDTDEDHCPNKPTRAPCHDDKFQCGDGTCIPKRWKCDGGQDCQDKSDEEGCPTKTTCSMSQFTCTSGKCIPESLKCNGSPDCPDGSDEVGCGTTLTPCRFDSFRCKQSSVCIDYSKVCDNFRDCPHGDDESPFCNINECSDHNGHCHHHCEDDVIGYKCYCNVGYRLANDSRACDDVNECEEYGICSQTCVNTKGSYKCGCADGYVLEGDLDRCKARAPAPYLVFGDEHSVRNLTMAGSWYTSLASDRKAPMSVDYHIESGYVYWTDVLDEKIARTRLDGNAGVENVVDNVEHSNGLAVDWIASNLYWTDESSKSIEVSQMSGKNRLRLFSINSGVPRGIAVDPFQRLLFWTDWGSIRPRIERASMDGNPVSRLVILDTDIIWPTTLTLDTILQRVYFADSKLQKIESCKYDGSLRKTVIPSGILHPLSLSVFEDYLYYSDYSLGEIFSVDKFTGKAHPSIISHLESPTGIAVVHPLRQKKVDTKCDENNGGCSHLCLLSTSVKKYSCRCPVGMQLHSDGKTCIKMTVVNKTVTSEPRLVTPTRKHATCDDDNGGCTHFCFVSSAGVICRCPKGMTLLDDGKSCRVLPPTGRATTKKKGTVSSVLQHSTSSSSHSGPLIAGVTIAVAFILLILVAIFLFWRKKTNYRDRTILFYKDNSRVPLQNDFDEDPLKPQDDVGSRSSIQFA